MIAAAALTRADFSRPAPRESLECAKAYRLCWSLARTGGAEERTLKLFRDYMRNRARAAVHLARQSQ